MKNIPLHQETLLEKLVITNMLLSRKVPEEASPKAYGSGSPLMLLPNMKIRMGEECLTVKLSDLPVYMDPDYSIDPTLFLSIAGRYN